MHEGQFQGLPVLFGSRNIWYNKTLFQKEGLEDPYTQYKRGEWTMERFLEAARRLTKFDERGMATQFGVLASPLDAWTFVWAFGGDILTPDGKRCIIDTPEAIEGLRLMRDLVYKWHVSPTTAESAMNAYTFESGRIAMFFQWAGQTPIYRKIRDFEWDVVPVPAGPRGRISMLKGNQLIMYRHARHPQEAWRFMKFYVSRDAERILYVKLRRAMPTRKDVAFDPEFLGSSLPPFHNDIWVDLYRDGRSLPITDRWVHWQRDWTDFYDLLMLGQLTPEEMVRQAAEAINRTLAEEPY